MLSGWVSSRGWLAGSVASLGLFKALGDQKARREEGLGGVGPGRAPGVSWWASGD